jgi:thioredoxin reductase (NADPH)
MITAADMRTSAAFAQLSADELGAIADRAADLRVPPGEWLIQEGEAASFFVLLDGHLVVLKAGRQISSYRPGDFFGELPLLLGSPAVASLRATVPCRVAGFDLASFRDLILSNDRLCGAVMKAMAARVSRLQQLGAQAPCDTVTVVGSGLDLACHDIRDFLARNSVPYRWLDPADPAVADHLSGLPLGRPLPLVVLGNGRVLAAPEPRALAAAVGLTTEPAHHDYDVVIVGGGPAGLAAAVYGASEGLSTLLVERTAIGGQAGTSSRIENYLGFPAGLSGDDLAARARQPADRFGADLVVARSVTALRPATDPGGAHTLLLDDDRPVQARSVVLAMGVNWRRLDVPGIERLSGRGVFYGAARTEALSMRGKHVHLVGAGNSAGQAAVLFASYASRVTMLVRGPSLSASMSDYLARQLAAKPNIDILLGSEVTACHGEMSLTGMSVRDRDTAAEREIRSDGLFIFIGAVAATGWLDDVAQRDTLGFLCTGPQVRSRRWPLRRDPLPLEISVPGIFAAGDARAGSIKRVASSVGEGGMAVALVHRHLSALASV